MLNGWCGHGGYTNPSGYLYSWLFDKPTASINVNIEFATDHGGNRTTKLRLGTYLTPLFTIVWKSIKILYPHHRIHYKKEGIVLIIREILTKNIYCWGSWPQLFDKSNFIWLRTNWLNRESNWWTQRNQVTEGCASFRVSYQECDESDSIALSVTISLARNATALNLPQLIRLLRRLILAADQRMAHWGRLPESRQLTP